MKFEKAYFFSLVAPLMIVFSIIGFISSKANKKIFYLPTGLMGILIIIEKEFSSRSKRKNILNKINQYKKNK